MSNVVDLKKYQETKYLRKLLKDQQTMLSAYLQSAKILQEWGHKYPIAFETLVYIQKCCVLLQNSIASIQEKLK